MDWYYCDQCGSVFSNEDIHIIAHSERHWWLDDQPSETLVEYLCPECRSSMIEECDYCEECLDPHKPGELIDGLCEECRKEHGIEDDYSQ